MIEFGQINVPLM